ncbi:hypothetical protein DL96DRAFT_1609307 [Flagelloscypha sp. PMI_526]|nr:hypothetical protein DL96DRAFT_1609307 [Flagelloscypha sp. PMI_526]
MSSAETTPPPTSDPVTSPPITSDPGSSGGSSQPPTSDPSTTSPTSTSSPSSSSPSSSPPPSSTSAPPSSSSVISSKPTVFTNSQGQVTTSIQLITVGAPTATETTSHSSKSSTGAIVGGVIGGVALLVVILALGIWYLRKRRREKEFDAFDGNFDPSKFVANSGGGTLPDIDLDDAPPGAPPDDGMGGRLAGSDVGGGVVTPYPYGSTPYGQEMTQHNMGRTGSPPLSASAAAVGGYYPHQGHGDYPDYAPGTPHTASTGSGYPQHTPTNPNFMPIPMPAVPHSPPPSGSSSGGSHPGPGGGYVPSSKEREAFGGRHVMNPDAEPAQQGRPTSVYSQEAHQNYLAHGPSLAASSTTSAGGDFNPYLGHAGNRGSGVVVHTDGGRVPEEPEPSGSGDEIPPTYESIPGNEERERPREKA